MPWWRKPFTLIWVPHDGGQARSISVRWITVIVAGTLGLFLMGLGLGAGTYTLMNPTGSPASLHAAEDASTEESRRLAQRVEALEAQLTRSRKLHESIMQLSGFAQFQLPDNRDDGLTDGSGDPIAGEKPRLNQLLKRNHRLEKLQEFVRSRNKVFRHTPMLWPVEGWLSSPYGYRQDPMGGRGRSFHDGVDVAAWHGSPVRASADGVVTDAGRKGGYGKIVKIRHEYGYTSLYGHLSRRLVKEGEEVRKGQVIGRVGTSGHSTGSHVHYEVRVNNKPINPWPYLVQHFETYQAYAQLEGGSRHAGTGS